MTDRPTFDRHTAADVPALLPSLCAVYADAYGVEASSEKADAFRRRTLNAIERPGFDLFGATADDQLVGFAFGCALSAGTHWWDDLRPAPDPAFVTEDDARTFVLSEIEVRRAWQGSGVGRALHDRLLGARTEERATLATGPSADEARAIYEAWGWQRVGTVPGATGEYFSEYTLYLLPLPLRSG